MEEFMVSKTGELFFFKDFRFKRIYDTSNSIENASCQQPDKLSGAQRNKYRFNIKYHNPAKTDIHNRRYPFWTGYPEKFEDNPEYCQYPYRN